MILVLLDLISNLNNSYTSFKPNFAKKRNMGDLNKWGGKRTGAGRPHIKECDKKIQTSLKLDSDNNDFLNSEKFKKLNTSKNRYINDAIREFRKKNK